MPGLLKPDAVCPKCGIRIEAMVRTTSQENVAVRYFHFRRYRKKPCSMNLSRDQERAISEEIHA